MRNEEEEKQIDNVLEITAQLALRHFTIDELCAFNNAIQVFERVDRQNMSYHRAVANRLIKEDGTAYELEALQRASAAVVLERIKV